jgi:predicted esterase
MRCKTYTNLLNEVLRLYHAGKFWEGYELITENADRIPRNDAQLYDFRASLACRAGRPELALELLTEAVMDKGCWYTQEYLTGDDDIRPAAQLPGFQSLMEVCADRERKAREESASDLAMVRGTGAGRLPLIIVLHGNMQNLPICQEDWLGAEGQGFDLAFVRSSQLAFSGAYVWNDLGIGARDLKHQLGRLREMGELDDRKVIIAGFSAGARMALHAVLTGLVKADGMVLVGPWLPEMGEWTTDVQRLGARMPGAYIVCGTKDEECLPGAKLLADTLELAGRPGRLYMPQGVGHDYPEGFAATLREAVSSITDPWDGP